MAHLFVYGSLRADSGHAMHRVLAAGASFVGKGSVAGELYHLGWHPGAVLAQRDGRRVRGELYRLHDAGQMLAVLDDYEGCGPADPEPHRFLRAETEVLLDGGERVTSWIYWFSGDVGDAGRIESGDWVPSP